jgi:hypothetical protein
MRQVGSFSLGDASAPAVSEGRTASGADCSGTARAYELTGPDGLHLTVRDTTWSNGERDVAASERHESPECFDTLIGRLRLSVQSHANAQYVELQQARRRGTRAQTFRADLGELDSAAGVDCATVLRHAGAFAVGTRAQLLDDDGRRREYVVASFLQGHDLVPVIAYVLTRVAPIAAGITA